MATSQRIFGKLSRNVKPPSRRRGPGRSVRSAHLPGGYFVSWILIEANSSIVPYWARRRLARPSKILHLKQTRLSAHGRGESSATHLRLDGARTAVFDGKGLQSRHGCIGHGDIGDNTKTCVIATGVRSAQA